MFLITYSSKFVPTNRVYPGAQYTSTCPVGLAIDRRAKLAVPTISSLSVRFAKCSLRVKSFRKTAILVSPLHK